MNEYLQEDNLCLGEGGNASFLCKLPIDSCVASMVKLKARAQQLRAEIPLYHTPGYFVKGKFAQIFISAAPEICALLLLDNL